MERDLIRQIEAAQARARAPAHAESLSGRTGSLSPRERLAALLDADSFVEYGALAGATSDPDDENHADGLVGGAGLIAGKAVVAATYDSTVKHGTQSSRNQRKLAKLLYLAVEHRWPFVCFVDGAGARTDDPLPAPPIADLTRGRFDVYDGLAELSGWAPTIAIASGRCLDGNAGIAMLSDCVIATEDAEFGSVGGPRRSAQEYAKDGNVDVIAADEREAIETARRYVSYFAVEAASGEPAPGAEEIAAIIPENRRRPYDMRKVLAAFADANSLLELGSSWGRSMLTTLARLGGRTIGIMANQPQSSLAGAIDAAACDKAARFIELCDAYEFPLVSFIDNPGYMVGPQAEREGIARHHTRPLSALFHRTVPLYSVQVRKAYGLGPFAMTGFGSGRKMPDLRLAWPSVESGGMSLEGAAYLVKRKEMLEASSPKEAVAIRDAYAEKKRDAAAGLRAGRTYQFDDVILPEQTRERVLALLERMPRILSATKKHPIDPH